MPDIAGLKLIVPTSVAGSGVSVSASGKVTFTAATTVSVNGCFTASYDNFLVVVRYDASVNDVGFICRMRASGTDNSTASSYVSQALTAESTTVSGGRSTSNQGQIGTTGDTEQGRHIYFYGPYLAQPTAWRSVGVGSVSGAIIADNAVTHNQSTAYDGFSLYPGSGNVTGALTVYGLSQ